MKSTSIRSVLFLAPLAVPLAPLAVLASVFMLSNRPTSVEAADHKDAPARSAYDAGARNFQREVWKAFGVIIDVEPFLLGTVAGDIVFERVEDPRPNVARGSGVPLGAYSISCPTKNGRRTCYFLLSIKELPDGRLIGVRTSEDGREEEVPVIVSEEPNPELGPHKALAVEENVGVVGTVHNKGKNERYTITITEMAK